MHLVIKKAASEKIADAGKCIQTFCGKAQDGEQWMKSNESFGAEVHY